MDGEDLKTRHVYHWRGPKGGRRQYVTVGEKGKSSIQWEKGGKNLPARWHLLYPSEPDADKNPKLVVFCQGARAAQAISAAGYYAVAITETTKPEKLTVEWAIDRLKGREIVLWPAKIEASFQSLYDVFAVLPSDARTTFANIRSLEEGQDATALTTARIVECIQSRGHPEAMPDPEKTEPKEYHSKSPAASAKMPLDVWAVNSEGAIARDSTHNVRSLLHREEMELSWNSLLCRAISRQRGREWTLTDDDEDDLIFRAYDVYGYRPITTNFRRFVGSIAREQSFDPITSYLESCPDPDDEKQALKGMQWLLEKIGLDSDPKSLDYRAVTLTLMGIIARQFQPGCPWKYMWVLAGKQDCGKSAVVREICPRKEWLREGIEHSEFRDKKTLAESTEGIIIVEAAELHAMNTKDDSAFKSRLSETKDGPYRPSHMRIPVSRERRYIFIGTSNKHNYLTDPTGNVRYWPTDVPEGVFCDFKKVRRNINRIWGCAMYLWLNRGSDDRERLGSVLDDARQLSRDMEPRHETHEADDPYREQLLNIKLSHAEAEDGIPIHDVMRKLGIGSDKYGMLAKTVGDRLRTLGWERDRGMGRRRVWRPPADALDPVDNDPSEEEDVPF